MLTGKQRSFLKGLANGMDAVVAFVEHVRAFSGSEPDVAIVVLGNVGDKVGGQWPFVGIGTKYVYLVTIVAEESFFGAVPDISLAVVINVVDIANGHFVFRG